MKTYILIGIFILSTTFLMAQKAPMKFGKIDIENLKMTHYKKDSSMSALILADYGKANLVYDQLKGWQILFEHHRRIKIISKEGYSWADVNIYLYHKFERQEKVTQLKGNTYNLEKGRIVINKLGKKSIFEEKFNSNQDVKKFTMPNVREGSIIEYSYTTTSDFLFNFQGWNFQHSIPVLWSEYRSSIPEYFKYQKSFTGYFLTFNVNTTDNRERTIRTSSKERTGDYNVKTSVSYNETKLGETNNRWVIENVPAFVAEPYLTTANNYIFKLIYELSSTNFPSSGFKQYRGTWDKMNKEFLKHELFGEKVSGSNFLGKEVDLVVANISDDKIKIAKIYSFVKGQVAWDGRYRKYVDINLKKPFDNKKGSSAEVNLILTSMLQKAGIDASPVLISTRKNGVIRKEVPNSSNFNSVICKVNIDEGYILLDATDQYLPLELLPENCLNGEGWVVSGTNSGWIDIATKKKSTKQTSGILTVSNDGVISGDIAFKHSGYKARKPRKNYLENGNDKYIDDIISESSWEIDELNLENGNDLSKSFVEKYKIEQMGALDVIGEKIYLYPIVSGSWNENPFKLEQREYPVDFAFPFGEKYYVSFMIPDQYEVEEIPQTMAIALPNNGGKYVFKISVAGNKITVLNTLNIKKTVYNKLEYPSVKEFFAQMVAKQKEQIILKKI